MIYNILLLTDGKTDNIENAKQLLEEIGHKFSRSFAFEYCDISASQDEIIKKAKSAHAVLLGGYTPALRGICKEHLHSICGESLRGICREHLHGIFGESLRGVCRELGLYASVRSIGDITLVNDAFGGIYDGEKGFRNNPTFGREAYDVESYSELEIERVARIAYELSPNRHITLIDKADELATSKLWRKIVTDINEDYPFVTVDMASIENALNAILQAQKHTPYTLLTSHLFGDIIYSVLFAKYNSSGERQQSKRNEVAALLGDTTLGMYTIGDNEYQTIAYMLRHSFDMQAEADYLESL